MIGTPEYQLAKFLDSLIKTYIPQTYMLQSTNQFLDHLANFQFHPAHKLVSFDVSSSVARGGSSPPHWLVKYAKKHVFCAFEADFL